MHRTVRFSGWSLLLLATTLFATLFVSATVAQPWFTNLLKEPPGVVSYTFREQFGRDVPATLDLIKAMGLTNIEFSNLFGKTADELRGLLDARGMRCTSFGVSYDDIQKRPETVIQNAKTLGARYVRVAWIPHERPFSLATVQQAAEHFNRFGALAHQQGLHFCYHNHGYEFGPAPAEAPVKGTLFDVLVAQTNPEHVSFEMDVAWTFLPGQDPAALLRKYPKRFRLMHLKDIRPGVPSNDQGRLAPENSVAMGTGQLNWKRVLKAARRSSVEYVYIEDESPAAPQQVPQSLTFLKRL